MKSINKYFAGIIFLVLTGIFNSCLNQLDIPQQGIQSIDDFYKTDEQAMNGLADVYGQFKDAYGYPYGILGAMNLMADDNYAGYGNMGDNGGHSHSLNSFTFDATRSSYLYNYCSGLIRRCNTILARVAPDSPVKRRILAECHVIRAWTFSYMAQLFGGVPLIEEEITVLNAIAPRASIAEVWEFVNKDFETAIASGELPSKSSVDDKENILRITKEAAQAWYGKSLLWQGKWSESATQLNAVIHSGKYQLLGDAQLVNHLGDPDFGYVVRATNNLSTESLFEFNAKNDQYGNSSGGLANASAYGYAPSCGWRADMLNYRGGLYDYVPEIDYIGQGNGAASVVRKQLYDAFVEMEGENGFRLKGSIKTWDDFQALGIGINNVYYGSEGYWCFKNRVLRSEAGSWAFGTGYAEANTCSNTWKPMRYAEVLLNAAEACIRSNDPGSALTYVNMVRERAHLAPLTSVTLADIKKEKRLELYKEGSRYIDLVRWEALNDADGITAANMLGEQGHFIPTFDGITVNHQAFILTEYGWKKGKHEVLPFPENELTANPMIEQNPGY